MGTMNAFSNECVKKFEAVLVARMSWFGGLDTSQSLVLEEYFI
jgi:hypothetical protein